MARKAGIALADILGLTERQNFAPVPALQDFLDRFAVIDHRSTRSPGAIVHHGRLQSIADSLSTETTELDVGVGTLAVPLVGEGLPFQLSTARAAGAGNLEPASEAWQLNIVLTDFVLTLDDLEPAIYVPESGTTPRHLLRDPQNKTVRIIGSATLRIQKRAGSSDVDILFVDQSDPLDPTLPSGAVASLTFSPPHFFVSSSEVGMTVGELLFDFSESYSPPHVLEQNQGPAWVGLAVREAMVYAPRNLPVVGDLSGGVRDLLIGRPMGIQGELEVQFGRTALDPATFNFVQEPDGSPLAVSGPGSDPAGEQPGRIVTIEGGQDEDVIVHAGFDTPAPPEPGTLPTGAIQEWTAIWAFDDDLGVEGDSASGTIRHLSVLRVLPIEIVTLDGEETRFNHPPVTFRFVAAGEAASISATVGSQSFENVVHLNGTAAAIGTVSLTAVSTAPGTSTFEWSIPSTGQVVADETFTPEVTGLDGQHTVVLKEKAEGEGTNRVSHLLLRIVEDGTLLVGCEAGVFAASDDATPLGLAAVEATYDLSDFHASGTLTAKAEQAVLDPGPGPTVVVPDDGLARVTLDGGTPGPATAPEPFDRHVQVQMYFEEDRVTQWGELRPKEDRASGNEADLQNQLLEWASHYPDAEFLVIGRCDDLGPDVEGEGPDDLNLALAKARAAKARSLLATLLPQAGGAVIDPARVHTRGETSDWDPGSEDGEVLEEHESIALTAENPEGIPLAGKSEAVGDPALAEGWLIKHQHPEHTGWVNTWQTDMPYEPDRERYRRADIFAVGGTPGEGRRRRTGKPERAPSKRRSMVPAADRTPTPVRPAASNIDYRVKLTIRWDSPTATGWRDAVPTLAEAEFAWTPVEAPLPPIGDAPVPVSKEVLTVHAKWVHDVRTGFTRTTLGIRSDGDPDGLVSTDQPNLTAALALGPMLLSGVDLERDVIGSGARVAALLGAAAFADVDLGNGEPLVGAGSRTALISVEAQAQTRALSDPAEDYQIRLTTEYVSTIHVNGGVLGIRTADERPMKVRYKQVGVEFDSSQEGWDQIGLAFDTSSMEVEDGGQWMIDGVLGQLLRIVEISFGRGSLWIEGRIAVAISIGVVEISEAIIRLTFEDGDPEPRFELRGFVVKADIPNVLEGEGRLRIEDGGTIRAGVDASIVPLGLGADAALALEKRASIDPDLFLSLFLAVQFSTPLPLAQSGAAIYGFKGMFAMNGSRALPSGSNDPVGRELDWWEKVRPKDKYEPDRGQYALGVGVVVGTMPDVSFCFSASGMLVVAFPDPEVILGVDVKVIEVPDTEVTDEGAPEGAITGLIVIDDEAVKVAVSAQYEIPEVLSLKVPFGAYFPYEGEGTYVRLGSDGQTDHGRYGEPITLTLLPTTLEAKAWAYLMIEQGGLPELGGDDRFSFEGFSVGFGAGWGIDWSAGPITLSASAKVLVGFGTNPLMIKGGVFVAGELDLVVVSISASGELILTYLDGEMYLDGEFCGEVDLFFFSLKGCVGVQIGGDSDFAPPPPEPPVASISLVDRRDRIMGSATPAGTPIQARPIFAVTGDGDNEGAAPTRNNTVWPDTAPVVHFTHYVRNDAAGGQFDIAPTPTQPIWFGGTRLKYTYRLDDLVLRRTRDGQVVAGADALDTVWMTTPYRQNNSSSDDNPTPSEHEGPNLKLLDWNPWTWVVNMDDGGAGTDGDPAKDVGGLCEPVPRPRRACVFGRAARGEGLYGVRLRQETPAEPPYPSRFHALGEPVFRTGTMQIRGRDLQTVFASTAASVIPGRIVDLPFTVTGEAENLDRGYRLPHVRRAVAGAMESAALPWEAAFDRVLARPKLTLLVCDAPGASGGGTKACTEFDGVAPTGKSTSLTHQDMVISAVNPRAPFTLVDWVDTGPDPDEMGQDQNADIAFRPEGILVSFQTPCTQVELHFMTRARTDITVQAISPSGRTVAGTTVTGPPERPIPAELSAAEGIQQVIITGGENVSVLYRVCRVRPGGGPGPEPEPEPEKACESFRGLEPSDKPVRNLTHRGLTIGVMQRGQTLRLVDAVDQRGRAPRRGSDGSAEIMFPSGGMTVELDRPCRSLEVWVMLFHPEPVVVVGLDADGNDVAKAGTTRNQDGLHRLVLEPRDDRPISRIVLEGGGSEAVLFRICCRDKPSGRSDCVGFEDLRIEGAVEKLTHQQVTFEDLSGQGGLRLGDAVDDRAGTAVPGRDGVPELSFPHKGLRITLPHGCEEVTVRLVLFAGEVQGRSLDSRGAATAEAATDTQGVEQELTFAGPDITVVELYGGSNEAMLLDVCCGTSASKAAGRDTSGRITDPIRATGGRAGTLPIVRGIVGDAPADTWPGRTLRTERSEGGTCEVIEYEPERSARGPWQGLQVLSMQGKDVTVLSVCGTDQVMVDARNADEAARRGRRDDLDDRASTPVQDRREVLLEAGEDYEIEVSWSWQAWESNEDGTDSPPAAGEIDDAAWQAGSAQRYRFGVAVEDPETGHTQDGLNEYVFDARDVSRHLTATEPPDGRAVHFTDDPVWVHFDAAHMEHLLEQYGRELTIEVRRTDPPPQSNPSELDAALAPRHGVLRWHSGPRGLQPVGYQRINDATAEAPCLPEAPLVGGGSLSGQFELEPSAMYDFNVIAPRSGSGTDTDSVVVSGTRFTTSRYAGPAELMTDLGYAVTGMAPYRPEDLILPDGAVLPGGTAVTSDALLDELMDAMGADTLPLPTDRPQTYVVWRKAATGWRIEGVLVDSLETLNRRATVATDDGTETRIRCTLKRARILSADFTPHRVNVSWTRVFLRPSSPLDPPDGRHDLVLEFTTSDGPLTGRRTISGVPAIVDREGL